MADYLVLSQDEQDDIIVGFMLSQELDKFTHELNLKRFDTMLESLPKGEWEKKVTGLRSDTAKRLEEVNSIIKATKSQLPPPERIEAAKQRLKTKEPNKEASDNSRGR